jgi:hypothetical protein
MNRLKIYPSPLVSPRQVKIKTHKRNPRINKKWLRRYGTKLVEQVIATPSGVYVSPATFLKLKAQFPNL